jgi:hypothetical protein
VRTNDRGDLVVTKGDQYDVREAGEVRNLGKPVELARRYYEEGADEITFLNITGFRDFPLEDMPMLEVLRQTSRNVFVPLTIGGGIRDYTDVNGRIYSALEVASEYFRSGADKVSIGSDAVAIAEAYLKTGRKAAAAPSKKSPGCTAARPWSFRSTPAGSTSTIRMTSPTRLSKPRIPDRRVSDTAGTSAPSGAAAKAVIWMPSPWPGPARNWGPGKSCSTASTGTAPTRALIWS